MAEMALGVRFKEDLIDSLGSEIIAYGRGGPAAMASMVFGNPFGVMLGGMDQLEAPGSFNLCVQLADHEFFQDFVDAVRRFVEKQQAEGWPFEQREYLGRVYHALKPGVLGRGTAEKAEELHLEPAYAVLDQLLVISTAPDGIHEVMRRLQTEEGAMAGGEAHQAIADLWPEHASWYSFSKGEAWQKGMDTLFRWLNGETTLGGPWDAGTIEQEVDDPELRALLAKCVRLKPLFQVLSSSLSFTTADDDGVIQVQGISFAAER
jgi:hypothetical protein